MATLMTRAEESEIGPMLLQRRILLSFCATVLIGVLLCATYLARRPRVILRPAAPPSQAIPTPATQAQSPAPVAAAPPSAKRIPGDTYLQIAAVDRGMAEVLVEVLRRKGFQAEVANGATEDIFRVMVGPAKDAAALARTKADLQAAGFTSFARKAPKLVAKQSENEPDSSPR
jgi:cell division septation protein DedD